jgi:phosphatidylglycerol:prolipoprotein diacylglycerol transferase
LDSPQRRRSPGRRRADFGGHDSTAITAPHDPPVCPTPTSSPDAVSIGPFAVRWYALAYIAGLVIGWQIMRRVCTQPPKVLSPDKIDDFLLWAALGVILGGRLGYVLFYKPAFFLQNPLQILTLWEGGMSFHGGLLGVIVAILAFSLQQRHLALPAVGPGRDRDADRPVLRPPRQLHQRRAVGPADRRAWAMIFPRGGRCRAIQPALPGVLRGHLLFAWSVVVWKWTDGRRRPGLLTGVFCMGYAWRASSARSSASPMPSRLPAGTAGHHGHAAVAARAGVRRLAGRPRLSQPGRCRLT